MARKGWKNGAICVANFGHCPLLLQKLHFPTKVKHWMEKKKVCPSIKVVLLQQFHGSKFKQELASSSLIFCNQVLALEATYYFRLSNFLPDHPIHSPWFSSTRKSYKGKKYFINDSADISFLPVMASNASGHDLENPNCINSLISSPVSGPPRLKSHWESGIDVESEELYWPDFTQSAS